MHIYIFIHEQNANTLRDIAVDQCTPINRLPDELLIEIFRLCFVDVELFLPPAARDVPLLLCNVCRRWRQVAVTVSVLWSTIKLSKRHSARFVSTWLSRAGTLPIGVSFILEPPRFRSRKSHRHFDVVVPLSRRWQYLELRILQGASFHLLRNLSSDALPSLEVLNISLNISDEGNTRIYLRSPFGNVFQSAPRLHSVDVWGVHSDPFHMALPWSQLIRFASDGYLSASSCRRLLDHLPKLQSGHFEIWLRSEISPIPLKRLSLPDLKTLDLSVASNIGDLFASLALPALQFLWIDCVRPEDWTHTNFMTFIAPFSFNLHTLQLFSPPMSETDIILCLLKMPSLVVLVLQDHRGFGFIGDRLMTLLTYGGSEDPPMCTKLETLHLVSVFVCQDELIACMLESRWRLEYVSHNLRIIRFYLSTYSYRQRSRRHSHAHKSMLLKRSRCMGHFRV